MEENQIPFLKLNFRFDTGDPKGLGSSETKFKVEATPVEYSFSENDHKMDNWVVFEQEDTPGCVQAEKNSGFELAFNNNPCDVGLPIKDLTQQYEIEKNDTIFSFRSSVTDGTVLDQIQPHSYSESKSYKMVAFDFSLDLNTKKASAEPKMLDEYRGFHQNTGSKKSSGILLQKMDHDVTDGSQQSLDMLTEPGEEPTEKVKDRCPKMCLTDSFDNSLLQTSSAFEVGLDTEEVDNWMTEISGLLEGQGSMLVESMNTEARNDSIETKDRNLVTVSSGTHMGINEISLLVEALQTRSFAPIAYLLSSALADKNTTFQSDMTTEYDTTRNVWGEDYKYKLIDELSSATSFPDRRVPTLSPQNSYESDQSSIWADIQTRPNISDKSSVWSDSQSRISSSDCSMDSDENFAGSQCSLSNWGNAERLIGDYSSSSFIDTLRKEIKQETLIMKNDKFFETMNNNAEQEIVNVIDDMIRSDKSCDLQTFKDLLEENESEQKVLVPERNQIKIWKHASTETTEINGDKMMIIDRNEEYRKSVNEKDEEAVKSTKPLNYRPGPNKCYHLWDFLRELLDSKCPPGTDVVQWINKESGEFRLTDTKRLAELWGQKKKLSNMNYDKLSRSLRYYIKLDILRKVNGKRLHFKFGKGRMWRKFKK